jgi:hypothetical protein
LFVLGEVAEAEPAPIAPSTARATILAPLATALSNCCHVYQCIGAIAKVYERTAELVEQHQTSWRADLSQARPHHSQLGRLSPVMMIA